MTYRQICSVNNNQVVVTLPPNFGNKKQVAVVVDDQVDNRRLQKLALLKDACNDPLFLADVKEMHQDFDSIEHETL